MTFLLPREHSEPFSVPMLSSIYRRAIVVAACAAAIGCRPSEQIHTYNVPKETAPQVATATSPDEPTDRMLAAILPDGDKAWFFKVVAPLTEINKCTDKVAKFFASVRMAAGKPRPDWELSEGWEEQPGAGMRIATIMIPTNGKPLELSVTSLPWTGDQADLLSNVNRWRGQMQLAPIGPQALTDCTRELAVGGKTLTIVDLRGRMQSTGMTPPIAAGVKPSGNVAAPPSAADLPAGHPAFARTGAADQTTVNYELPEGWQTVPASGIRKAALRVADGAREAMVTVIDLPAAAGPMVADPLANVNRWRSEVGMEPLTADDLSAATEQIKVDGFQAIYMEAIPDAVKGEESTALRGTLAAMANGGDVVWFIKITGDLELVVAQRDQFKSFLNSVRFVAHGEPSNGN